MAEDKEEKKIKNVEEKSAKPKDVSDPKKLGNLPKKDTEKEVKDEDADTGKAKKKSKKRKVKPKLSRGKVFVQSTYNNTIVTVTDLNGNVVAWESAGAIGFKGAKKSTPYAAGLVVKSLMDKIAPTGLKQVDVFVKGIGSGREAAVRALGTEGLTVNIIKDVTPVPHNGCRSKKVRRV